MKVGKLYPRFVRIYPYSKDNRKILFLYNKVASIVEKGTGIPAVYHTDKIELPRATEEVLKQLRAVNIRWRTVKNKKS